MSDAFIEVTGATFVSGDAKPSGKFVIAVSEIASIEHGPNNTSVIVLDGGERFSVIEPYGELKDMLKD